MAPSTSNAPSAHKRKRETTDGEAGPSNVRGGGRGRGSTRGGGGGRGASASGSRGRGGASRGRGRGAAAAGGGKQRKIEQQQEEEEEEEGGDAPVGVSKLKAQLRQTRRLLKKDNVAPPVRQEAQRREVALLSEIETRERENVEREHAKASHAARFFDRQKLVRRIRKMLKKDEGIEEGDKEASVREARVRLNYVLNWPHQHPYVPLYPTHGTPPLPERMLPPKPSSKAPSESEKLALEVRARIVKRMEEGSLPLEPEVELLTRAKEGGATKKRDDLGALERESESEAAGEEGEGEDVVAADDFFAKEGESDDDE